MRRLDDVRVQRGLAASSTAGEAKGGGVAQQKRDLDEKQRMMEGEVEEMRVKNKEGDVKLKGVCNYLFCYMLSQCLPISCTSSYCSPTFIYSLYYTELLQQQSEHQAQAIASRNKRMAVAEMKNTTIDDLTRGLINYKYLGLGFERVGRENELL